MRFATIRNGARQLSPAPGLRVASKVFFMGKSHSTAAADANPRGQRRALDTAVANSLTADSMTSDTKSASRDYVRSPDLEKIRARYLRSIPTYQSARRHPGRENQPRERSRRSCSTGDRGHGTHTVAAGKRTSRNAGPAWLVGPQRELTRSLVGWKSPGNTRFWLIDCVGVLILRTAAPVAFCSDRWCVLFRSLAALVLSAAWYGNPGAPYSANKNQCFAGMVVCGPLPSLD